MTPDPPPGHEDQSGRRRADQGVRGLPERRPSLPGHRRGVDDRLRPHRGRRAEQPASDRGAGERAAGKGSRLEVRTVRRRDRRATQPTSVRRPGVICIQRRSWGRRRVDQRGTGPAGEELEGGGRRIAGLGQGRRSLRRRADPAAPGRAGAVPVGGRSAPGYRADEQSWIPEYDQLQRTGKNPGRRAQLRAAMADRRKSIWRAAQPKAAGGDGNGWNVNARRARYASLLARST